MNRQRTLFSSARWIYEISKRFARVDRRGRLSVASRLSELGICFGVMTLITVISVMNGFQSESINPIMELSSFHVRAKNIASEQDQDFIELCKKSRYITSAVPFYESQGLLLGARNKNTPAIIRALPSDVLFLDKGFASELRIISGEFDLSSPDNIVVGYGLSREIGVSVGSTVNIAALSGGKDVSLISKNRQFTVTGIFYCSYADIHNSMSFVNLEAAQKYFGKDSPRVYGIKLSDYAADGQAIAYLKPLFSTAEFVSWRQYNRAFFGALRIEKNILMILVCIIFVVVGINIYNGMRRIVFERKTDISLLSALGGTKNEIRMIFVLRGAAAGIKGSLAGLVLGILLCRNMGAVFRTLGTLFNNPAFVWFARIPPKMILHEVIFITLFGIVAPLLASAQAGKSVLDTHIAEVLHNE